MGKGGGGGTTQSTGTTYNTNIPEYARPYVETMLGATQQQLFTGPDGGPLTKNAEGNYEIGGFKPYQAYSSNPNDYVAGFSPMQQQAQQTVANMQVPGSYGQAMDVTGQGIMGAMGTGQQAQGLMGMGRQASMAGNQYARQATNPYATQAYMSPYMQNVVDVQQQEAMRQSQMQGLGDRAQAVKAGAFGGSRQGLVEAERQRNLATQLGTIQATGLQSAFDKAQANQQYAANLGLQGLQAGAGMYGQGIGAQQAAINQAMQGANQYANLGAQAQQAQTNIANLQNQYGAQQQAAEQQKINQAIQDWANTQQYPLMQLGVMSNMLRGLPMQASTTNQYVAAPNPITQGIGAAGASASLYNALKGASGGLPREFKYASGGITSVPGYSVGGDVKAQLEDMSVEQLQRQATESSSPTIRAMAKEILNEKQMARAEASKGVGPTGPMGVDYQATPVQAAAGGILAFQEPNEENNYGVTDSSDSLDGIQLAQAETKAKTAAAPRASASDSEPVTTTAAPAPRPPAPAPRPPMPAPAATPAPVAQRTGIAQVPPPAAGPAWLDKDTRALYGQAAADMKKSEADFARERREGLIAAGVDPDNTAAMDMRNKLMSERANSADEAKRQRFMRLAEFFGRWGSTPGSTLAAGLSAMQKTIPDVITDEKELKKANRELDKMMYDIDHAIRLEKKGDYDKAADRKEKAAQIGMKMADTVMAGTASIRGHEISKSGQVEAATISATERANATAATNRRIDEQSYSNAKRDHLKAVEGLSAVEKTIEKEKAEDQEYKRQNYIIGSKSATQPQKQAAQAYIDKKDAEWKLRKDRAKDLIDTYQEEMETYQGRLRKTDDEGKSKGDGKSSAPTRPIESFQR